MISLVEEREKRGGELVTFYNWEEGGRKGKRREKMGRRRRRIGRHARFPNYAERNYWYYFEWREMEFGGWRRNARIENRRYTACVSRRGCLLLLEISGS